MNHIIKIGILVFLLFGMVRCQKETNNKTTNNTNSYDFSYTGNLWVGDTISFQTTAPSNSSFLWTFGDGSTSTLATPTHIYDSIAYIIDPVSQVPVAVPDTVTLLINNDSAHIIKKMLQIVPGIQRVASIRTWRRTRYEGPNGNITAYPMPDTTFALTVISDMKVFAFGDTLNYTQYLSDQHDFKYTSKDLLFDPVFVDYLYPSDTVSIMVDSSGGAMGGRSYIMYNYP